MNRTILTFIIIIASASFNISAQNVKSAVALSDSSYVYLDSMYSELPEVMVKGEKPIAKIEKGRLVYDMPRIMDKHPSDNAFEGLTKIPGIREENDVLFLANHSVNIIINGRISTMTYSQLVNMLKTIPTSQVVKAEVMLTTPAKYNVRGASINIITKDNSGTHSVTGQIQSSMNISDYLTFKEQGNITYSHDKLSLDVNYNYRKGKQYGKSIREVNHPLADGPVYLNIVNEGEFNYIVNNLRVGCDYAFSKNNRLSASYTGKWDSTNSSTKATGSENSSSNSKYHEYMHNVSVSYSSSFGMNVGADYTYFDNPRNQSLLGKINDNEKDLLSVSGQRIKKWLMYINQEHHFKSNFELNYGTRLQITSNNSYQDCTDLKGNIVPEASSSVNIDEKIFNSYIGFNKSFGQKLSVEGSFAAELFHTEVWNKWSFYPTFTMSWQPSSSHSIQLSFESDKKYPSYWSTLSSTYYSSAYTEIQGNPDLKPSKDYELSLNYTYKGKYNIGAFIENTPDYFIQMPYQTTERLAMIMKETNFNYKKVIGGNVSAQFRFGSFINADTYAYFFDIKEKSDKFFDIPFNRECFTARIGSMITTSLSKKPLIQLTLSPFYQSPTIQGIYDIHGLFGVNSQLRVTSNDKRFSLTANLQNVTNYSMITTIDYMNQNSKMKMSEGIRRALTISAIYRFGNYKEKKHNEVDTSRMGH